MNPYATTHPESERSGLKPDMVIADRFRLTQKLGEGGMGCVWRARHLTLGIDVAIKFIDASMVKNDEVRSRFAQEAMAAARIKSPHVVSILDYGLDATGRPYIAMELLVGEDLGQRLDRQKTLCVSDVARIVAQGCRGLGKAHAEGIVHRDLKPENLFLCDDDDGFHLKILDFGIAKSELAASHQTALGAVIGTPTYMSPEQARGDGTIDHRADLYSLATVAYHALVGAPPFSPDNLQALLIALVTRNPTPLSVRQPQLTTKFDAWFARALAKSPNQRFQNAREMAETFIMLCSAVAPAVEDWSSTGAEPHALHVPEPTQTTERQDVGNLQTCSLGGEVNTSRGLNDPPPHPDASDEEPQTVVAPLPCSNDDDDDDDGETQVGGFFHPATSGDRMRVVVPSDPGPSSGDRESEVEPVPFFNLREVLGEQGALPPRKGTSSSHAPRRQSPPWTIALVAFFTAILVASLALILALFLLHPP